MGKLLVEVDGLMGVIFIDINDYNYVQIDESLLTIIESLVKKYSVPLKYINCSQIVWCKMYTIKEKKCVDFPILESQKKDFDKEATNKLRQLVESFT